MTDRSSWLGNVQKKVQNDFGHWAELYVVSEFDTEPHESVVPLRSTTASRFLERTHSLVTMDDYKNSIEPVRTPIPSLRDLYEALHSQRHLLLVGESGSGKTTTLERFALYLATDVRATVPVYLHLSQVKESVQDSVKKVIGVTLEDAAKLAEVVVLLDGLNEVDKTKRDLAIAWIKDHQLPTLIACRPSSDHLKSFSLGRVEIRRLDVFKVREFILRFFDESDTERLFWMLAGRSVRETWRWYQHRVSSPDAFKRFWLGQTSVPTLSVETRGVELERLRQAYRVSDRLPELLEVARNPFILFWIVQIYHRTGNLPEKRVDLFRQMIELLVRKRGHLAQDEVQISSQLADALAVLSFRMQTQGVDTVVSRETAVLLMKREDDIEIDAVALVELAVSVSLLQVVGQSDVKFRHQLLQEYCAALELERCYRTLGHSSFFSTGDWWSSTQWDASFLFAAELTEDPLGLVEWLALTRPSLAFACSEMPGVDVPPDKLAELLANPKTLQPPCPHARAIWAQGGLGDPPEARVGTGLGPNGIPEIRWVLIPEGRFRMGGDELLADLHDQGHVEWVEIPYTYQLGAYPVTVEQYRAFADSGGYGIVTYWCSEGWAWKADRTAPDGWEEQLRSSVATDPVVNVSWYEADAFCSWLSHVLGHIGGANEERVRLPTEAEWEHAARFPDGRIYPWGSTYRPGQANIDETADLDRQGPYYLGRRTPVGIYEYGRSELNLYDMGGNVWEWTASAYVETFKFPENNRSDVNANFRSIRGGSWLNSARFTRCAFRDHLDPDFAVSDIGFRVACGPVPLS